MPQTSKLKWRFWIIVTLLVLLPVVTYLSQSLAPGDTLGRDWPAIVWLIYLCLAFVLRSRIVLWMLIGMFLSGAALPGVGRYEDILVRQLTSALVGGFFGCLVGFFLEGVAAVRQRKP